MRSESTPDKKGQIGKVKPMKLDLATILPATLIGISIVVAIIMVVVVSFVRDLTSLETTLFQVVTLGAGLSGSYIFGRSSATDSAREALRLHARPAFRRALELYRRLYFLSVEIENLKEEGEDRRLDIIQAIVNEQIRTGDSTIEDWRDIVPDDVEDVVNRLGENESNTRDNENGNSN